MQSQRLNAYAGPYTEPMNSREIEEAMLTRAALKLERCRSNWDADDSQSRLQEALKYNQKLWSVFQVELDCDQHAMPASLRHNLLVLSNFIDRRTLELYAEPDPEKLALLIDINQQLAAGLRSETGDKAGSSYDQ